jgi:hypothetical protein
VIDAFASADHYLRHLAPIIDALGDDFGTLYRLPGQVDKYDTTPILIAGAADLDSTSQRPVALAEHGAGQMYQGLEHRSWAGGLGREKVGLFLCPRWEIADANRARYPDAQVAVVGCPALDRHESIRFNNPHLGRSVVAFTFHADYPTARHVPELRSAFDHYRSQLPDIVHALQAEGVTVVGHHHPRFTGLRHFWRKLGLEVVSDWDALLPRISALVVDNSSVGWEAAALGVPVVWLNAPWYRPDVEHGLRFWGSAHYGRQADHPGRVAGAVLEGLRDGPVVDGPTAMRSVYTFHDGRCAERAAVAVRSWVDGPHATRRTPRSGRRREREAGGRPGS